ncbi:MAG: LpqB family beta-propeller domain-containing protein [Vicinamibacterales bacterium]
MPPDTVEVGAGADYPFGLALAPDGRRLAFPAARAGVVSLWLHDLSTGEARPLPSTDGAAAPFWSPDGARIGFLGHGRFRALDVSSGSVSDLVEAPEGRGGAWNQAGDLVFAPQAAGGLMRRSADGAIAPLTTIDREAGESAHSWPAFLPDGRHVAFLVTASERSRAGIWLASLDDPAARTRIAASDAQPVITGQTLLVLNNATLMAQPLDAVTGLAAGRDTLAGLPVGRGPLGQLFATTSGDVLIYGPPGSYLRELRWVSRTGDTLGQAGEPAESWDLRIAPDGRRVVVTQLDPQLRTLDVWIRTGTQPVPTRLSLGTDMDERGVWSPDGLRVAWVGQRRHIMIRGAGAVLPEQTAASFNEPPLQLWDWSRDGGLLLAGRTDAQTRADLWVLPQIEGGTPGAYLAASFHQTHGAFSPDGRHVAYASDESGQFEIYVDSFPEPGARTRVTTAGGTEPRWRRDGAELYFRRGGEVHAVRLARGKTVAGVTPPPVVQSVERLFDAGAPIRAFDVTPDGARFLLNLPAASAAPRSATMVVNWKPGNPEGLPPPTP